MDQISMFDLMYPTFKTDNPVRLIELFAGVGSQAMALRNLGVPFEHYLMSEWEMHATASYKAIHMADDDTDYSAEMSSEDVIQALTQLGISVDGKKPLTEEQIRSHSYSDAWRRECYNNIKATDYKDPPKVLVEEKVNGRQNNRSRLTEPGKRSPGQGPSFIGGVFAKQ